MNDGRKENGWWNMETMIRLKANGFVHIGWTFLVGLKYMVMRPSNCQMNMISLNRSIMTR